MKSLSIRFKKIASIFGLLLTANLAFAGAPPMPIPVLEFCPGTVGGWTTPNDGFQNFTCRDREWLFLRNGGTYDLDVNGNLILNSMQPEEAAFLYQYVTGFAEYTGPGCSVIDVTSVDEYDTLVPGDGQDEIIRRQFTAQCDGSPSPDICYQDIVIEDCEPWELNDPTSIPTLSQWGVILFTLSIMGLAALARRRFF